MINKKRVLSFIPIVLYFSLFLNCNPALALTEKQARCFFGISPDHKVNFLAIAGYQQNTDYTCGPAVVMSLLHYYHRLKDQQMNADTEKKIAREMGTTEAEGTNHKQIANWLNRHGFRAVVYTDGSVEKLRNYIAAGIPVLVDWIDWGGHWVATAGYVYGKQKKESSHDLVFFADPAAHFDNVTTKDGITWINSERFSSMWFNSNHQKNIYIVAIPN
jgi:hypothetical protein